MASTKAKQTTTEAIQTASPTENEVIAKTPKKTPAPESSKATEVKAVVATDVKTSPKKQKIVKAKVVRDSFSFPELDYLKISELKKTCLEAGIHVKKSEILRAGLHLLTNLDLAELKQVVEQVEKVRTGRPNASKT